MARWCHSHGTRSDLASGFDLHVHVFVYSNGKRICARSSTRLAGPSTTCSILLLCSALSMLFAGVWSAPTARAARPVGHGQRLRAALAMAATWWTDTDVALRYNRWSHCGCKVTCNAGMFEPTRTGEGRA